MKFHTYQIDYKFLELMEKNRRDDGVLNMIISLLFVCIVVFFVFFFGISMKEEEEESMSKFRNLYLYLVSFVTLMMILGGIIFTVHNITDLVFPTNYYNEPWLYEREGNITEEEKVVYEENQKRNQENQIMERKKNVAKSVAVVIVALPTFIYHWRKIEKENKGIEA